MPPLRTNTPSSENAGTPKSAMSSKYFDKPVEVVPDQLVVNAIPKLLSTDPKPITYPLSTEERDAFKTKLGKRLTAHQWAVYDYTLTIPKGKVITYKTLSLHCGGSPRSVGATLRTNPFAPYVPCHRVVASNLFVGGYMGEWGQHHKSGAYYAKKVGLLEEEGVRVDERGYLVGDCVWDRDRDGMEG